MVLSPERTIKVNKLFELKPFWLGIVQTAAKTLRDLINSGGTLTMEAEPWACRNTFRAKHQAW